MVGGRGMNGMGWERVLGDLESPSHVASMFLRGTEANHGRYFYLASWLSAESGWYLYTAITNC